MEWCSAADFAASRAKGGNLAGIAAYWPEFAAEGKHRPTLCDLLAHRAGLIGVDGGFTTAELAGDRPGPAPGR